MFQPSAGKPCGAKKTQAADPEPDGEQTASLGDPFSIYIYVRR